MIYKNQCIDQIDVIKYTALMKQKSVGGRPRKTAEYVEGPVAFANFQGAMNKILGNAKESESIQPKQRPNF